MRPTMHHVQCKLRKGNEYQASWIPEKYARLGKFVKLQDEEGVWDDGWQVVEAHTRLDSKTVIERSQDYKKTRKASDV